MNHAQVAAKVRQEKERHPERFCSSRSCLWRTAHGLCPKHQKEGQLNALRLYQPGGQR